MKFTYLALLSGIVFISCKPKFEMPEEHLGTVNVTNYIVLGGSNTAGFSDGAFNLVGQENSYAQILSEQFNRIETSAFNQSLVSEAGINLDGNSKLIVGYKIDCNDEESLSPVRFNPTGDNSILSTNVSGDGPFNNLALPSMSTINVNQTGYNNNFFDRIASSSFTESILGIALANNPTFYTAQLGEDDILAFATSGATTTPVPTNGAAGVGFEGSLEEVITSMVAAGAKGALLNIPDVLNHPHFTTIPYNGLDLDSEQVESLNTAFNPLGISFEEGPNGFLIEDSTQPFGVRKMLPGEKILLTIPLDSVKCLGMGITDYIPDRYSLTLEEIEVIEQMITEYNLVISNLANQNNVALVDLNSLYNTFHNGTIYNGVNMSTAFISGGTFSLDGLNLNPIGQAKIANAIIEELNTFYNAAIPLADVTKYPGIIFP